jgi:WD40 repeat protein
LDVERLVQRIGEPSYKLIVIHGQSGVGKSSLVSGGLVPALKQKAFGTSVQDAFPVSMRVYKGWVEGLGRLLTEALEQKGIQLTTPLDSVAAILEQLKQNEKQRNLRTVLIFDQFEEFFFAYPHPGQRRQFFEFLGDCLKILSLKALLLLREDYIHYLLECNRLPSMAIINNDILSKNVLYPLGNFSPADARAIIQRLMERSNFQLEPTLIEVLVQDLAGELGEVRPIELQIVGAQLQTDKIKTLSEYRERGQKDELVKRYLNEVVKNCGSENQNAAQLVLYLLTDEKGTRPLRTRAEVERDLQELVEDSTTEASRLDLVFKIFVDSGLVVLLPENPDARYQLVHDYLAAFIRQQQEPTLKQLMAELEKERKQRQEAEKQSKLVEKRLELSEQDKHTLETELQQVKQDLEAAKAELNSTNQKIKAAKTNLIEAEAEREEAIAATKLELKGLNALQQFQSSQINALVAAMRAGHKLKLLIKDGHSCGKYSTFSPLSALQQILNNIREKNRFQGHRDEVKSVSFSPDGQCLATASSDGTARVWDLQGNQVLKLRKLQSKVNSVSFSPDGQRLATASSDGRARVWDLQGNQLLRLRRLESKVNSVSFSPDGQYLATASNDSTARVWDLQGNKLVDFIGHQGHVNSVSFSPDGQYLVTASNDSTARVWDLQGNKLVDFIGHQGYVNSVNFSPDGQRLATASNDSTARVWDLQGNKLVDFIGHQGYVNSVNFSPDGQYLATASDDGTARVWDLQGNKLVEFQSNESWVWSVSFSPNGHYLATALSDSTVRLWDLQGKQSMEFKKHQEDSNSVSFSPDEHSLATTSDDATTELLRVEDLDQLLARGCEWLRDYLTTNPNVRKSDRHLCDNIKIQE